MILGAPTSIAAFVGHVAAGPVNQAVQVLSFAEFDRTFGGPRHESPLAHAVEQFFQNGGSTAWVIRVAPCADGSGPAADGILGVRSKKTGLYALEDVPAFSILNLPEVVDPDVLEAAIGYAEERRSMILIDMGPTVETPDAAVAWIEDTVREGLHRPNAAVYFPRIATSHPLDDSGSRGFANSGAIAGLSAR